MYLEGPWTRCPVCEKLHVLPPTARFVCSCGTVWWWGWKVGS